MVPKKCLEVLSSIIQVVSKIKAVDRITWREDKYKGCLKKMSRFVFFNFSGLEKAAVLNDTFLKCILKELSKTVFKSFLRQFSSEI